MTTRCAGLKLDGHVYMVRWPAGMDREMQEAMDQRINRPGVWQGKPGIMVLWKALQAAGMDLVTEALGNERT